MYPRLAKCFSLQNVEIIDVQHHPLGHVLNIRTVEAFLERLLRMWPNDFLIRRANVVVWKPGTVYHNNKE